MNTNNRMEIFACRASKDFAAKVVDHLKEIREPGEPEIELGKLEVTMFSDGEFQPSYTDSGDGAAEDYLMLWKRGEQWVYNDSRENPLTDFYGMYGGRIGYVMEKVG